MRVPTVRGIIDRRILVNYRLDPEVLGDLLPQPFRPKLVNGHAVAGICLIRLRGIRPQAVPHWLGVGSENAAHRAAVVWDEPEENGESVTREGVFIFRRDTSSRFNAIVGGRLFPGVHHLASFDTQETETDFRVRVKSRDQSVRIKVAGHRGTSLQSGSVFETLSGASCAIEHGSVGYSPGRVADQFDGLKLSLSDSSVQPLILDQVESSFFDNRERFPAGSIEFDSALLMRNVEHEWHDLGLLSSGSAVRCGC